MANRLPLGGPTARSTPPWIVHPRAPSGPPRRGLTVVPPQAPNDSWSGQLFYVDDLLVVVLLSRIIVNAELCLALQSSREMEPLKSWLPERRVPADINPALAAVCLIRAVERHVVLPVLDASTQIGQPASAGGKVTGLDRESDDLILRIHALDSGARTGMRLLGGVRQGWQPIDLRGRTVLGVGLTRRARYRQLDAAAIAFLPSGATPS
jgi:hypothetical protein